MPAKKNTGNGGVSVSLSESIELWNEGRNALQSVYEKLEVMLNETELVQNDEAW